MYASSQTFRVFADHVGKSRFECALGADVLASKGILSNDESLGETAHFGGSVAATPDPTSGGPRLKENEMAASRRYLKLGAALADSPTMVRESLAQTRYVRVNYTTDTHRDPSARGIMSMAEGPNDTFLAKPLAEQRSWHQRSRQEAHPLEGSPVLLELMVSIEMEHADGPVGHTCWRKLMHAVLRPSARAHAEGMGRGDYTCVRIMGNGAGRLLQATGAGELRYT